MRVLTAVSRLAVRACLALSVSPGLPALVPRLASRVTLAVRADARDVIFIYVDIYPWPPSREGGGLRAVYQGMPGTQTQPTVVVYRGVRDRDREAALVHGHDRREGGGPPASRWGGPVRHPLSSVGLSHCPCQLGVSRPNPSPVGRYSNSVRLLLLDIALQCHSLEPCFLLS